MAGGRENLQEAQRRSDETESKPVEERKGRTGDLSRDQKNRQQRPIAIGSIPSSDQGKEKMKGNEKGMAESSKEDCRFYLKNGWCGFRYCVLNHPPIPSSDNRKEMMKEDCGFYLTNGWCRWRTNCHRNHPMRTRMPICELFLRGACLRSLCLFQHIKPEEQMNKRQRTEAQDNVQENQALGGAQDNLQEMPEDQNLDAHHDQPNLEGQRQRDIQRERMESRQRLNQMKRTAEFNEPSGLGKSIEKFGFKRQKDDGL